MTARPAVASPAAARLLIALREARAARGIGAPLTDAELSRLVGVPPRRIIDLAYELIELGYLVVATCDSAAPGRFLLRPGDDLAAARRYLRVLESRGRKVFARLRRFRAALDAAECRTSPDSAGQYSLGWEVSP